MGERRRAPGSREQVLRLLSATLDDIHSRGRCYILLSLYADVCFSVPIEIVPVSCILHKTTVSIMQAVRLCSVSNI